MNSAKSKSNGRSARWKAIREKRHWIMWGFMLTICLLFASCNEKTKGQDMAHNKKDTSEIMKEKLDSPQVSINVKRHYDEEGNLIGIDSTYSSFYSSIEGDKFKMDSVINSFDSYFNRNHPRFFQREFNSLFFNDSVFYPDFFNHDFFMKRYELNDKYFRDMMQRMDSIKNHFYHEQKNKRKNLKEL